MHEPARPLGPPRRRAARRSTTRLARRQAIVDTAAALMQERGFLGTTIEAVAAELDFTKAAFYYYVKNKEELLYEISMLSLDATLAAISEIVARDLPPHAKLQAIIENLVRTICSRPAVFTVYFQEKGHLSPEHLAAVTERERQIGALIKQVYREGVARGELRDLPASVAVFGLLGMCFWVYKWYRVDGALAPAAIAAVLQQLAAHGYLATPGDQPPTAPARSG